jgi:hypothetical protein
MKKMLVGAIVVVAGLLAATYFFGGPIVIDVVPPLKLELVTDVDLGPIDRFVARDHFTFDLKYSGSQKIEQGEAYKFWAGDTQYFRNESGEYEAKPSYFLTHLFDKVENGMGKTDIKIYRLTESAYDKAIVPPSDICDMETTCLITLGQFYALLAKDIGVAPKAPLSGNGDFNAAVFLAESDAQTRESDRPLLFGNPFGYVVAYVRGSDGRVWSLVANWSFAGSKWNIYAASASESGAIPGHPHVHVIVGS